MKKLMLIGASKAGKSTLSQVVLGRKIDYKKTQALEYKDFIIDTPGEYIENRNFYTALIAASAKADVIGIVVDSTAPQFRIPPNFASIFCKEVIGIVTKIDHQKADIDQAIKLLKEVGVSRIIKTSAYKKIGIKELKEVLSDK